MAARPPTPPTTPPIIAPRLVFDESPLLFVTGTAVVGVVTIVCVLETTITDPPGRVDEDAITESEVVGGKVDMLEDAALLAEDGLSVIDEDELGGFEDETLPPPPLLSLEQVVVKRVAVALVIVTGTVMTTWTSDV